MSDSMAWFLVLFWTGPIGLGVFLAGLGVFYWGQGHVKKSQRE